MGISAGQSSSHWPQLMHESDICANRLMWNIEFGGSSPAFTIMEFFISASAAVKQTGQFSIHE